MIIYRATKKGFIMDCRLGRIADAVREEYEKHIGRANLAEVRAWDSSLRCMASVLDTDTIDDYVTICAEYRLPNCGSRIDLIVAGSDSNGRDNVVIVELKQWEKSVPETERKLVRTFVGGCERYVAHPSYQAWSYAVTLENYNEAIESRKISLFPCAYLHNYTYFSGDGINDTTVYPEITQAPLFFREGGDKLRLFITDHVVKPSSGAIMDTIDNGRLRPSASLQDVLSKIMKGSREFIMIDDQKVFFENIMAHVKRTGAENKKHVFIIEGGPGTGKSVLAINLLAETVKTGRSASYVSKNAAPRNVYSAMLARDRFRKAAIKSLFLSSGSFVTAKEDSFDALFVDEAHRLNEKSGRYHNEGKNQIKEIIRAAKVSVFFIDERQIISSYDIGSVADIEFWAEELGAEVHSGRLSSQFRCNGSDGYMSFLDDVLDISHGYYTFDPADYDIRVADDPEEMMSIIKQKNLKDNKARMLAGYCWDWVSKNDHSKYDIVIGPSFRAQWNFNNTLTWAIDRDSVDQIGCIHTSQGLEFSYAGVIIGDDLRFENGKVITDFSARAKTDKTTLKGLIVPCRKGDKEALHKADMIIRNTYRTLLSRAMKGCIVYCTDRALADHIRSSIEENRRRVNEFMASAVAETNAGY